MCEYTSMFGGKKSENLKNYNDRGSLERAYNTASGTAKKTEWDYGVSLAQLLTYL